MKKTNKQSITNKNENMKKNRYQENPESNREYEKKCEENPSLKKEYEKTNVRKILN